MFTPGEHEQTFPIKPMGVRYICEHCGIGEMKVDISNQAAISLLSMPQMIKHICDHCGGELYLPKTYPYIVWDPEE